MLLAIWTGLAPNDLVYFVVFQRALSPSFSTLPGVCPCPIASRDFCSIPFWIADCLCFPAPGKPFIPSSGAVFLPPFSGNVIGYFWHGDVLPLLICLLWITWSSPEPTCPA